MTRHGVLSLLLSSLVGITGCGGEVVGTEGRPAPDPSKPTAVPAPELSPADVDTSLASCSAPHGDVRRYSTVDEMVSLLSGAWLYCASDEPPTSLSPMTASRNGIEFTVDGHAFWLGRDESRGVVRGRGLEGAMTYEIEPPSNAQYNNASFQMNLWYADRSVMPTYATFEDGPRRLTLQGIDGWFVPLLSR